MIRVDERSVSRKDKITVSFFFHNSKKAFLLKLFSDETGFTRTIKEQNLHRPGLALAGFVDLFSFSRIQIFGNTEMRYLERLSDEDKEKALRNIFQFEIPCIIITDNNKPFDKFIDIANEFNIPVFGSSLPTTKLEYLVTDFLEDQFSERISIHGSFVDVYGIGILFVGKSGVGKSEVALDLIERGHRLVADDVIYLTKKGEGILIGSGTSINKHFMEIRGLGILDIERTFGIRAIRYQKRLEIIVELEVWDDKTEYTRTGLDESTFDIRGISIPYVKLPILPGKNLTVISEVIALNYLLKHYGYNAAEVFKSNLSHRMSLPPDKDLDIRGVGYFEHDFE